MVSDIRSESKYTINSHSSYSDCIAIIRNISSDIYLGVNLLIIGIESISYAVGSHGFKTPTATNGKGQEIMAQDLLR
jgi:hypothetical protein